MLLKVFILLIECVESTKNITLHSKQLEISSSKTKVIEIASSDVCKISEQKYIADLDFYIIYLETSLKKEFSYLIYLEYRGNLMDGLAGYYKSGYLDRNKKNHWLAVTQFEPTDARRAFPCFDEPNLKASFQISLGRKKRYKTISNMKLAHTVAMRSKPGWFWDKYEISLPMSTYLVAFVISDFGFQTASHGHNNITFNIWARNNALNQVEFAKEVCPKVLAFYEQYFRFNYPLNKLDMIALPDFNAGAMENWGLITFREIYLLLDPKSYSISNKYKISSVIAHELAHQWFGNLVTMKWWTDLWLNEGFATYMAGIAIHSLYPSWNSLNEEAVTTLLQVYALDSLKSSHPVSLAIHNVNEINQMFDTISYKKGSFLIRMMSHFLTETILQKGVSYYLKQHAYSNAEQDDLWDALTEQAHTEHILPHQFTVKHIMDTWTLQIGYPLINVIRNYDNGIVEITQERFYKNVIHKPLKEQCWWIPLTYTTNQFFNNTKPRLWMSCPKKMKKLRIKNANDWIIFNIQATGLYRVNYDETNWKMIITYLKKMTRFQIPEINRVLLIDNAMELAWIGHLKYDIAFDLLLYIKNDLNYLPWETALQKLESISNVLKRTPYHEHIQSFIKTLIYPVYMRLDGFNISKEKWKSLDGIKYQSLIARTACKYKVDECNRKTLELFESWRSNPKKSNTQNDTRYSVSCVL